MTSRIEESSNEDSASINRREQPITLTVQTSLKPSIRKSIFQNLKVRIIEGGFTNVTIF